jgi:hypothetical protein
MVVSLNFETAVFAILTTRWRVGSLPPARLRIEFPANNGPASGTPRFWNPIQIVAPSTPIEPISFETLCRDTLISLHNEAIEIV